MARWKSRFERPPETVVKAVRPIDGGYTVEAEDSLATFGKRLTFRGKRVISPLVCLVQWTSYSNENDKRGLPVPRIGSVNSFVQIPSH